MEYSQTMSKDAWPPLEKEYRTFHDFRSIVRRTSPKSALLPERCHRKRVPDIAPRQNVDRLSVIPTSRTHPDCRHSGARPNTVDVATIVEHPEWRTTRRAAEPHLPFSRCSTFFNFPVTADSQGRRADLAPDGFPVFPSHLWSYLPQQSRAPPHQHRHRRWHPCPYATG